MKIRPSRLLLWGGAAAVVALLVWSFRPRPVPVDFGAVTRGTLRVTIDEEGVTRVRERYVISAPVAGRLQRVQLDPGDQVVGGQTALATFAPAAPILLDARTRAEAEARAKAAAAARDQARVALQRSRDEAAFAHSELQRQREIAKFGGTTDERLAAAELEARTRASQVAAAELALQAAEYDLAAAQATVRTMTNPAGAAGGAIITLRSPIDGVVLRVVQESEAVVPAGTALIEVGNPDQLEVVADLLSSDAVRVRPGFPVAITGWGGEAELPGRVRLVEPGGFTKVSALGVEEQRVNVLIDFANARDEVKKLGDGYRVDVSIVVWEREGVLTIPTSALFREGTDWAVFLLKEGRASRTRVEIGQRNALQAEVRSGVAEGDQVIVHPGDTVADGVAVTAR